MRYTAPQITMHQSAEQEAKTYGLAWCAVHLHLSNYNGLRLRLEKRWEMVSFLFLSHSLFFFFPPSKKTFVVKKYVKLNLCFLFFTGVHIFISYVGGATARGNKSPLVSLSTLSIRKLCLACPLESQNFSFDWTTWLSYGSVFSTLIFHAHDGSN